MTALVPCPICQAGSDARWRCAFCAPPAASGPRWPVWALAGFAAALLLAAVIFGVEAVLLAVVDHGPARYPAAAAGSSFVGGILAAQVAHLLGALDEARDDVAAAEAMAARTSRFAAQLAATQPIDLAMTRPIQTVGPRRARRPDAGRITVGGAITVGLLLVLAATFYGLLGGLWQVAVDPLCTALPGFCGGTR